VAEVLTSLDDARVVLASLELLSVARNAEDVLSAQAAYFRDRSTEALIYSRRREAELRRELIRALRIVEGG
jgi:hypothetical protein